MCVFSCILQGKKRYKIVILGPLTKAVLLLIIPSNLPGDEVIIPCNRHVPPDSALAKELMRKACSAGLGFSLMLSRTAVFIDVSIFTNYGVLGGKWAGRIPLPNLHSTDVARMLGGGVESSTHNPKPGGSAR